jgi:eukaryotic-like serine/threonine-protein kinase
MSASDPSPPGTIGPYRIVARVGAGGMGEVFKAWDPRLERDVAIKVLHPGTALDPERQRRLLAEGRAASALCHPNILRVYDADVDGASYYLVSEWLEGKSLRDELSRGPLPLKRLLDLSVQIADGLAAAHAIGIVHRDIKPENVMLARDGTARIVDFGLARSDPQSTAFSETHGHMTTISVEGGLSGTPAYMSPEQARGSGGDFRTDQFSFGALVYEMATGAFAFRRDSVADTLSAVLHEEPKPIAEINPRIPAVLRWIVDQCLAKDATERYSATDDLARELRRVRDRLLEARAEPKSIDGPSAGRTGWKAVATVAIGALALGVIATGFLLRGPASPMPSFTPFASASHYEGSPAWSADGQTLAYVADVDGVLQIFVKRVGDALERQVTQGRFDAQHPFWAPNGQLVYFISPAGDTDALWSAGVAGGRPELVLENVAKAAIDPEGKRLALLRNDPTRVLRNSLWWSTPIGAEPTQESRPPFDHIKGTVGQLAFSADGQLLVWMNAVSGFAVTAQAESKFYLVPNGTGSPREILSGLTTSPNLSRIGWLPDNRHVVLPLPDPRLGTRHLWVADTVSGTSTPLTATHTNESDPAVSPTGQVVAYASDEVDFDLALITTDGQARRTVLATARNEFSPAWSPSGDQFAFVTDRSGSLEIWARSRDGKFERPIVTAKDFGASQTQTLGSLAFSRDGRTLAYQRSAEGSFAVWLSPVTGGTPVRLVSGNLMGSFADAPAWSPDDEWIAYSQTLSEQENSQVTLQKIRVGSQESVRLLDGITPGTSTAWSPDGQWILCQTNEGLVRIAAEGGPTKVLVSEPPIDFTFAPDSRHVFVLAESETSGHFALIEIDHPTGTVKVINPDLGPIPIANQPIRGFSFSKEQGVLTSLASARSDIWLMEGFQQPGGWLSRWLRRSR